MTQKSKNKISYMHFIMSVLVILIHSINNNSKFERFFSIESGIGQFAVPLFFMISGFLFFVNVSSESDVRNKLRKRIKTLLVPYILWNLIYYAMHLLINPGTAFSINELFDAAFYYKYNPTFWFMYQLILVSILSIFIWFILKSKIYITIGFIVISLLIVMFINNSFVNLDALLYYYLGAASSVFYKENKIEIINKRNFIKCFILLFVMYILNRLIYGFLSSNYSADMVQVFTLSVVYVRICGAMFLFYICDFIFKYEKVYNFMNDTFLLYAIHYMIVRLIIKIYNFVFNLFNSLTLINKDEYALIVGIMLFIISPFVCIFVNSFLSKFLKTKYNKVYELLTGSR